MLQRPTISDDDRRSFRLYWDAMIRYKKELDDAAVEIALTIPAFATLAKELTPQAQEEQRKKSMAHQRAALLEDNWDDYLREALTQGTIYAKMGIEFSAWFEILRSYRAVLLPKLREHYATEPDHAYAAIAGANRFIDIAMSAIGDAYLEAKQDIIRKQSAAIRELSTPVLQVMPRLLIVPLVGVVDTHRARQVTEQLLHAVRARRARVVVIDITGVPIVDSKVANHLMQTVEAAALMGALVIISGISPEIAQTLVTIGAELRGIRTAGDLEEAIELSQELLRARSTSDDLTEDDDGGARQPDGRSHRELVDTGSARRVR